MSLATLVPTAIGGAQAAVSTASQIKNLAAGFAPRISGFDVVTRLAKDIGTFEFDYIGEERVEAGTEITDHYTEDNDFMQDNCAVKPSIIVMRGFVAELALNKTSLFPFITAALSALTPITPYLGAYAPGAAAKMADAVSQTDQIINQLAQVQRITQGAMKIAQLATSLLSPITKAQQAYNKLDALRTSGTTFAVVTPWATFGDNPDNGHGPMMIEHLVMVSPDETRGWADIVVRLKEIRVAPSLVNVTQNNARGSQVPFYNGAIRASTSPLGITPFR